jgi:conjugal transfer pilus assembly protein TraB
MRLTAWWRALDPRWQRWLMIGGVMMVLIAGVYPFLSQDHPPHRSGRDETIKQILTDQDPRALGFDGLMAELKTLRAQFETTRRDLEQLQTGQPTSLQENLRRQQSDLQGAVNELRELREVVRRLEHPTPKPEASPLPKLDVPPPAKPPVTPLSSPATPQSPPAPPAGKALFPGTLQESIHACHLPHRRGSVDGRVQSVARGRRRFQLSAGSVRRPLPVGPGGLSGHQHHRPSGQRRRQACYPSEPGIPGSNFGGPVAR